VEQIPECDVLVACLSSVSRWAIAARKVVMNLDIYRFGINDYPGVPSFVHADSFDQFQTKFAALLNDRSMFSMLSRASEQFTGEMGVIDGRSAGRIANELRHLLRN
jgi:hypothetical protein